MLMPLRYHACGSYCSCTISHSENNGPKTGYSALPVSFHTSIVPMHFFHLNNGSSNIDFSFSESELLDVVWSMLTDPEGETASR